MAKWAMIFFYIHLTCPLFSQSGEILNLRFNETYHFLESDTVDNFYSQLKYIPFMKSSSRYLSMGGEVRYQSQYFKNEDFKKHEPDYLAFYTRFMYHADFHPAKLIRLFTQLTSTFATGRPTPNRTIDENRLDIHQLFFDLRSKPAIQNEGLVLRIGRQELLYGSQRLISVREGPNNRLSFDAVKLFYTAPGFNADVFYARPVNIGLLSFDDYINDNKHLWGLYTVKDMQHLIKHVDLYYIGYWNKTSVFVDGADEEIRHSFGTRAWNKADRLHSDVEIVFQFGRVEKKAITAYTVSADVAYIFSGSEIPNLGIKTSIISGDQRQKDDQLNTFNPLFPRGAYFGLAGLIGPANLIDIHPYFQMNLSRSFSLMIDYDMFWRHSINDGIYGPNAGLIISDTGKSKHIGDQLGVSSEFTPTKHLSITSEFTWFDTGAYLKEVDRGMDVLFGSVTIQFKF